MPHLANLTIPLSPLNITDWALDRESGQLKRTGREQRRNGVIIYGAGHGTKQAPLMDPEWEVWALNVIPPIDRAGRLRADRWFDLHQLVAQSADDLRWIAKCPCPIYLPPDLLHASPQGVPYPLAAIEKAFGSYWTCTFAYQIALALWEGYTNIGIFGVELAYGTERERTVEWACTSWWLGYAEAKGVTIYAPAGTLMGRHPARYGLEYTAEKEAVEQYLEQVRGFDGVAAGG